MNGATVSDPKSWVGLNLSYPAMVEELPGLEHQCKHSSIYGKPHVNTSKAPQFQENMVGEMVNIEDAFKFLDQMAYPPSADDIFCILQKCRKQKHLTYAKRVHEHICDIGLDAHKMLEGHFVPMFVECGSVHDAQHAFNRLVARDEYSWTYLIQGYINSGGLQHAFELFRRMQEDCVHPSRYTYVVLLKACAGMKCITRGREIHTEIAKEGYENDTFVRSTLVDIYMKIGSLAEAREVFDELQVRDVVLWTALIGGYAEQGLSEEALNCFEQMQQEGVSPDQVTYICSLKSCSSLGAVDTGQGIHGEIVKDGFEIDPYVGSALVGMYAKCGLLEEAQELLHELPMRGVVVWNALIAGYSEHGLGEEALKCLEQMRSDSISPNDVTFVCSLKACGSTGAVQMGQEVHVQIVKQGFESDSFVGSILIDMYTKCGSLEEAHEVFKELAARDVVSWTTFIAGYVEHGFFEEALNCLEEMQVEGTSPDALTLACILNGCGSTRAIERGREAHIETVKRGLGGGPFISSTLVKMYAESGLFAEAQDVFNKLPVKDVMSWNALIGGFADYGLGEEALNCMQQMRLEGPSIDATTFLNSLKACSCIEAAEKGFEVHSEIVKYGFEVDLFIGNILVDMYSKFGCLSEAQEVFDGLPGRGTVSWTALIAGHAEHGHGKEVLNCLEHMQVEGVPQDVVTFVCSLKACCSIGALNKGRELHNEIVNEGLESDTFLGSTLVDMYAKWGSLLEAQVILDELPVRNVVSWTAVIAAYAEQAHFEDAVRCLEQMQLEGVSPNAVTYVSVLKACSSTRVINKGREVHSEIVKVGIECKSLICSSLVDLYAKCGLLTESQEVFDMLSARDLLSWNALIGGYAEHGHGQKALDCFEQMQVEGMNPDDVTYIYSLKACGSLGTIGIGQQIYTGIIKKGFDLNPFVSNSLVDMYAKRCAFLEARKVFDQLPIRDTVSWNPLIVGYFEQGLGQEALSCFEQMRLEGASPDVVSWNAVLLGCAEQGENERVFMMYAQMQEQGIPPNSATFVSIIKACGNTAAIELGEKFYAQFCRDGGLEATEIIMATALIDMYGKCGSMANAQQVFDTMPTRDPTMWNALITGYSRQGESEHALHLFERMKKEGTDPDAITFLCVLTVCNHAGLRDKAQEYFESMIKEYGIPSSIKHHNCMIDLLGRAGQLNDALMLLKQMPFQPNDATLNTLLGACRKWGNVEVGKQVFECAVRLDQKHAGAFVLMSNIYADVHMWEDSRKIEALRLNLQALKKPPKSWIEIGGVVQTFVADDTTHSQSQDIDAKLKHLSSKIEENLVTAGTHHVLVNLPMNTELDVSGGESENLAIACGLINTPEEKPLRIVKNSQVSDACHVTLAVVSEVERRTIFCRDASGFHVSKDGKCSCGG